MGRAVQIRVLGDVRAVDAAGASLRIAKKPQLLLALLASRHGMAADNDWLVEALYEGESMPLHPADALRGVVFTLRKSLGSTNAIESENQTYRLTLQTDLEVSNALVGEARQLRDPVEVSTALEKALRLWTGRPFGTKKQSVALDSSITALEEQRFQLTEELLTQLLLVDARRVVELGQPWFAEFPLRDAPVRLLVEAYAAEGRRDDLLDVFTQHRRALIDRGVDEPSVELRELESRMFAGGATQTRPRNTVSPIVATTGHEPQGPFVGRESELSQLLETLLNNAAASIIGEKGIGKSALLANVEQRLNDRGRAVHSILVNAQPTKPLEPVVGLLAALTDVAEVTFESHLEEACVTMLLGGDSTASSPIEVGRDDLLNTVPLFLRRSLVQSQSIAVVDDVHGIDPMSAAILASTVSAGPCALLFSGRPSNRPHVRSLLRAQDQLEVDLQGLSEESVAEFVDLRFNGRQRSGQATQLFRKSGGNPLFLALLVDMALEGAELDSLPESSLEGFTERLLRLDEHVVDVLQWSSAMEHDIDTQLVAMHWTGAEEAFETAAKERLISYDSERGHARFVHDIVRDAAYRLMPDALRWQSHYDIASIMSDLAGRSPIEYVDHFNRAAEGLQLARGRAVVANLDAGMRYADSHDAELAMQYFETGLALLESNDQRGTRLEAQLLLRLGGTQRLLADTKHVETLTRAASVARDLGDVELFTSAVIELCSHGGTTKAGRSDKPTLDLINEAQRQEGLPSTDRAALLAASTTLMALASSYRTGQQNFHEAVALVEGMDDVEVRARVFVHTHLGYSNPADFAKRPAAIDALEACAGTNVDLQWEVAYLRFWETFRKAQLEDMSEHLETMQKLTPRAWHRKLSTKHIECAYAHIRGEVDEARELQTEARRIATLEMDLPESWITAHQSGMTFAVHDSEGFSNTGDTTVGRRSRRSMQTAIERIDLDLPEFPNWRAGTALLACLNGEKKAARSMLSELTKGSFSAFHEDITWTATISTAARVAYIVEDRDAATILYDLLLPHQGEMSWAGTCTFGPNDWFLGLLAELLENDSEAAAHHIVADDMFERLGTKRPTLI